MSARGCGWLPNDVLVRRLSLPLVMHSLKGALVAIVAIRMGVVWTIGEPVNSLNWKHIQSVC